MCSGGFLLDASSRPSSNWPKSDDAIDLASDLRRARVALPTSPRPERSRSETEPVTPPSVGRHGAGRAGHTVSEDMSLVITAGEAPPSDDCVLAAYSQAFQISVATEPGSGSVGGSLSAARGGRPVTVRDVATMLQHEDGATHRRGGSGYVIEARRRRLVARSGSNRRRRDLVAKDYYKESGDFGSRAYLAWRSRTRPPRPQPRGVGAPRSASASARRSSRSLNSCARSRACPSWCPTSSTASPTCRRSCRRASPTSPSGGVGGAVQERLVPARQPRSGAVRVMAGLGRNARRRRRASP